MCLEIEKGQQSVVANKNITCFKHISQYNFSEYTDYKYTLLKKNLCIEIEDYVKTNSTDVIRGYHSYRSRWTHRNCLLKNMLCIIPKGERYYKGYHGDERGYTSTNIVMVGNVWYPLSWIKKWLIDFGVIKPK